MRHSRWLRRRYYPLFLEEIYKPILLDLSFVNIGSLTKGLWEFINTHFLCEWSQWRREIISHTLLAPLAVSHASSIYDKQAERLLTGISSWEDFLVQRHTAVLLKKEVFEQPFLALLFSDFLFEEKESSYFAFKFLSNFIAREATPEVNEKLVLQYVSRAYSEIKDEFTAFWIFPAFSVFAFGFPCQLLTQSNMISISKQMTALLFPCDFIYISSPINRSSLVFSSRVALHSSKYYREDEDEVTPFLKSFKLALTFIYPLLLETSLCSINNLFALRRKLIGFKIFEKLRTPDIVFLALSFGTSYISSPEIVSLCISSEFDYDLQSIVRLDKNLNLFLVGKLEKSYLGLLKLIIEDASGEFLLDIAKSIFDVIEAYILQPGVLKFSL